MPSFLVAPFQQGVAAAVVFSGRAHRESHSEEKGEAINKYVSEARSESYWNYLS